MQNMMQATRPGGMIIFEPAPGMDDLVTRVTVDPSASEGKYIAGLSAPLEEEYRERRQVAELYEQLVPGGLEGAGLSLDEFIDASAHLKTQTFRWRSDPVPAAEQTPPGSAWREAVTDENPAEFDAWLNAVDEGGNVVDRYVAAARHIVESRGSDDIREQSISCVCGGNARCTGCAGAGAVPLFPTIHFTNSQSGAREEIVHDVAGLIVNDPGLLREERSFRRYSPTDAIGERKVYPDFVGMFVPVLRKLGIEDPNEAVITAGTSWLASEFIGNAQGRSSPLGSVWWSKKGSQIESGEHFGGIKPQDAINQWQMAVARAAQPLVTLSEAPLSTTELGTTHAEVQMLPPFHVALGALRTRVEERGAKLAYCPMDDLNTGLHTFFTVGVGENGDRHYQNLGTSSSQHIRVAMHVASRTLDILGES